MLFTAEQIQVLYECAMSIGTSLDLRKMLRTSINTFLKKTNCSVGIVYFHEQDESGNYMYRSVFSIPRDVTRVKDMERPLSNIPELTDEMGLAAFQSSLPLHGQAADHSWFHLMPLPDVGVVLLLKRGDDLAEHTRRALVPLFEKLANACQACMQNDELVQHQTNLKQLVEIKSGELVARNEQLAEEIEARKRSEDALRKSEAELKALFAAMSDVVIMLDSKGTYLKIVSTSPELLYASPAELLGTNISDVFPGDTAQFFLEQINKCLKSDTGLISFDYNLDIDGKSVWFEGRLSRITDEAVVLVARDITPRIKVRQALEQANSQLERMVNVDSLTQVPNRRFFDEALKREWRRMARERQPLSLIMFDIDFFKNYNDLYGHLAGDDALKLVAKTIEENVKRPADAVARYGGEEFIVILPNTDAVGAKQKAEAIQEDIRALGVEHEASDVSDVLTTSAGIASLIPESDVTEATLVLLADKALYGAKSAGRNRCQFYGEMSEDNGSAVCRIPGPEVEE